ncbi:embryonic polarity protein dorsal-like [Trichogramma pretiosum]|uniref:embryonic polarity protein dorsal-like n=1 Tax=Trichogramma pretiosum TaxID=7493 RepID=UPI0006C9D7CE|nr:embryonic polarity protein dorsal-like [Trichogramma pretiosum]
MSSQEIKRVCTRSLAPRDFINANKVKVVIDEQPCGKVRYDRRAQGGQAATPLLGARSLGRPGEKKSYPSLRVLNCRGPGLVLVSLVTEQAPYYPHPNRLARLRGAADSKCQNGVYLSEIDSRDGEGDTMKVVFKNLAIQRVDERDVAAELEIRKKAKVDPFQTGYEHASETSKIDLGCVRMCFQVFLKNKVTQKFDVMLDPVISEPILDTSAENDISIQFASHASDSVIGGTEMCVLCKRLDRDDIKVVFHDAESGWKCEARLCSPGVWNRCALLFKVPTYCDPGIEEPRQVTVQLRRPSDGAVSQAVPFTYRPVAPRTSGRKRKRDPVFEETTDDLERLAEEDANLITIIDESILNIEPWQLPERSLLSMRYSSYNYEPSKSTGRCQTDLPEIRHDNIDEELAKWENMYNDGNPSDVDKFVCHQSFAPYTPESLKDDDADSKKPASPDSTELLDERLNSKRKYKIHPVKDAAGLNQIGRNLLDIDPNWLEQDAYLRHRR